MIAHSQGTFCSLAHFEINTTAPAVGLSRVPQKTTKLRYVPYGTTYLFLGCTNPKKKKATTRSRIYVLVQQ